MKELTKKYLTVGVVWSFDYANILHLDLRIYSSLAGSVQQEKNFILISNRRLDKEGRVQLQRAFLMKIALEA